MLAEQIRHEIRQRMTGDVRYRDITPRQIANALKERGLAAERGDLQLRQYVSMIKSKYRSSIIDHARELLAKSPQIATQGGDDVCDWLRDAGCPVTIDLLPELPAELPSEVSATKACDVDSANGTLEECVRAYLAMPREDRVRMYRIIRDLA